MKKLLTFLLALAIFNSCKSDEGAVNYYNFNVKLVGTSEFPPTASAATGTFVAQYYKATRVLTYTITFKDITPNAWHIHKGAIGTTGAIIFNFGSTFSNPYTATTVSLTTDQEKDLLAGNYYVNIHSALYTNGEIRGQLIAEVE